MCGTICRYFTHIITCPLVLEPEDLWGGGMFFGRHIPKVFHFHLKLSQSNFIYVCMCIYIYIYIHMCLYIHIRYIRYAKPFVQ